MKESDLYEPIKILLNSWGLEVHGEVAHYDVVGIGQTFQVIVELKTRLSFSLLDQAIERVGRADYVFIAVPKKKTEQHKSALLLLKHIGVGLIEVDFNKYSKAKENLLLNAMLHEADIDFSPVDLGINIVQWGKRFKQKRFGAEATIKRNMNKTTKNQIGGVTSSEVNSPYKLTIKNIKNYLEFYHENEGWADVETIIKSVKTHYQTPEQAVRATLTADWNKEWIEYKKVGNKPFFRSKLNKFFVRENKNVVK